MYLKAATGANMIIYVKLGYHPCKNTVNMALATGSLKQEEKVHLGEGSVRL